MKPVEFDPKERGARWPFRVIMLALLFLMAALFAWQGASLLLASTAVELRCDSRRVSFLCEVGRFFVGALPPALHSRFLGLLSLFCAAVIAAFMWPAWRGTGRQ